MRKKEDVQIDGQMSIFDMMAKAEEKPKAEAPAPKEEQEEPKKEPEDFYSILQPKQEIYDVLKAEIIKRRVVSKYRVEGRTQTFYHTKDVYEEGGSVTDDTKIGVTTFLTKEEAIAVAAAYEDKYEMIKASSIVWEKARCWQKERKTDGRMLFAWYAVGIPNADGTTMLYCKDYMTFQHAYKLKNANEVEAKIKEFIKGVEEYQMEPCNTDFIKYKMENLYPCKEGSDWDFAEAEYSGTYDKEKDKTAKYEAKATGKPFLCMYRYNRYGEIERPTEAAIKRDLEDGCKRCSTCTRWVIDTVEKQKPAGWGVYGYCCAPWNNKLQSSTGAESCCEAYEPLMITQHRSFKNLKWEEVAAIITTYTGLRFSKSWGLDDGRKADTFYYEFPSGNTIEITPDYLVQYDQTAYGVGKIEDILEIVNKAMEKEGVENPMAAVQKGDS